MSEPRFYALHEDRCLAFGRRVAAMFAQQDVDEWKKLYSVLAGLRRAPYLGSDGTLALDAEPLVRFDSHLAPNQRHVLPSQAVLPSDSDDIQWLLMNAVLQSSEERLFIPWANFSFGWTITIPDERVVRPGLEHEEFAALVALLFEHPGGLPPELGFLGQASHQHAYVDAGRVRALGEVEDRAGLLGRLGQAYAASGEPITRSFGESILRLRHFLGLASIGGTAVFMCYYTP